MKELVIFIGLLTGNIIAQAFMDGPLALALERSYFQGIALFAYWLCTKVIGKENEN